MRNTRAVPVSPIAFAEPQVRPHHRRRSSPPVPSPQRALTDISPVPFRVRLSALSPRSGAALGAERNRTPFVLATSSTVPE